MKVEPIASGSGSARAVKQTADTSDENNVAANVSQLSIEYEPCKGPKDTLHGISFQLMLLVLCLKRAITLGWDFRLATEIKWAGKFGDIVLIVIQENEIHNRRYQVKHKQMESKCIKANNLFTETGGDYFLPKYFESYQLVKSNPDIKKKHTEEQIIKTIDEFIICTNIDIDGDVKDKYFERVESVDPILNVGGSRYKMKLKKEIIDEIYPYFNEGISKLHQLASALYTHKSSDKPPPLVLEYQKFLVTEIIDVDRKTFRNNFRENSDLTPTATEFRNALKKQTFHYNFKDTSDRSPTATKFRNTPKTKSARERMTFTESINFEFKMSGNPKFEKCSEFAEYICKAIETAEPKQIIRRKDFNNNINNLSGWVLITNAENEIKFSNAFLNNSNLLPAVLELRKNILRTLKVEVLREVSLKISNFSKVKDYNDTLLSCVTQQNVIDFLSETVIAVNQPNEIKLRKIIGNEFGKDYKLIDGDIVTSQVVEEVFNFLKSKEGTWITCQKGNQILTDIKIKVNSLIMIGASLYKKSFLESFNIELKPETLIALKETIENNQVTIIKSDGNTVLGSVALLKALKDSYKEQDSYIFMEYEHILYLKEKVFTAFEHSRQLLIVEFQRDKHDKKKEKDLKTVCRELKKILVKNPKKKLVLISNSENILKQLTLIKFHSCLEINLNEFSEQTCRDNLRKTCNV